MKYIALIADIIGSKLIVDREEFQLNLKTFFTKLNNESSKIIISPYTITLGDEFQAVHSDATQLFNDIFKIWTHLYPHKLRVAIGIGTITTDINSNIAIGMDGPAFHVAREGISALKDKTNNILQLYSEKNREIELCNQSLILLSHALKNWNRNMFEIMSMLLENKSIEAISEKCGISTQGVYKNKQKHEMDAIKKLIKLIIETINIEMSKK